MSSSQFVAPCPLIPGSNRISFFLLRFEHAYALGNRLWSLVKLRQAVRVLHLVRFSQLIEVNLTKGKRVIVLKLMVFRRDVFRAGLHALLAIRQCNLGFSTVGYTLDGDHTSCFSKCTDRAHLSCLERHSSSKLQSALLASQSAELLLALFPHRLRSRRFIRHRLIGLFSNWYKLVDRVLHVCLPSGNFSRQAAHLIEDLLCSKCHLGESCGRSAFRLLAVVSWLHAIGDLSFIGVGLACFDLLLSDLDG